MTYPKRLIEVDLPIKKISEHASREKYIHHGHISTLHIWWARRPLAACRAVICAALWPDPGDPNCPERFKTEAARLMKAFRDKRGGKQWNWSDGIEIRQALLDFIADFANWDNSTNKDYLETSRALTQIAHESLGGEPGTRPLVVDPFAGGGAMPLEALRIGSDTFASDLNPISVLLNKIILEYIPKYGDILLDEIQKWGELVRKNVEKEMKEVYPKDDDGYVPVCYIWARVIRCEGPNCGAEIPLLRQIWLCNKKDKKVALKLIPDEIKKTIEFEIINNPKEDFVITGTIRNGSAICPICNFTTQSKNVRQQLIQQNGGSNDARLIAVITVKPGIQGKLYRLPSAKDIEAFNRAGEKLALLNNVILDDFSIIPLEPINPLRPSPNARGLSAVTRIGINNFGALFNKRQLFTLVLITEAIKNIQNNLFENIKERTLAVAILTALSCVLGRLLNQFCSISRWNNAGESTVGVFSRQALAIVWDFVEKSPFNASTSEWESSLEWILLVIKNLIASHLKNGTAQICSATKSGLADGLVDSIITDPPYYDAIPYADLSDFFYVWHKRTIGNLYPDLFMSDLVPKEQEIIVTASANAYGNKKDKKFFESEMTKAFSELNRILKKNGIAVIVFAHSTTAGWEAILNAIIKSGLYITSSWPIDTEMASRIRAREAASLQSSIHIVCRSRYQNSAIGDWRDILHELPKRIHEWMPRLAKEGVVGADAIFACLGPALEIFSRYSRVEKASGEVVTLKEYLAHVWAAVAKEALNMIFEGADTSGFEEDARLTAMWLWTLSTAKNGNGNGKQSRLVPDDAEEMHEDEEEYQKSGKAKLSGYFLEYDAARKIAQGLGVHLEKLQTLVEVKGDKARLIPVDERTKALFGKTENDATIRKSKKKLPQKQFDFMKELEEVEKSSTLGEKHVTQLGNTILDRLHQAMILFAAGRGEALKRFLVEEGVGRDERFWRLAQAFSALYPKNSDEKRWVDGVMARKKGLGF